MERKIIIVITGEESRYIQKVLQVSTTTVWHAVKYIRNNDIHKKIRKFAIERGNSQMVFAPEFDTIFTTNHEDADGEMTEYMMQVFENGATLEGNRSTGLAAVRNKRGEIKGECQNLHISELKAIQEVAMNL